MEALSPRDANARRFPKPTETKMKTAAQLRNLKDKEHPPPPPPEVHEPASSDRPNGATYEVGKLLGKGGFAICYSGYLLPTRQKYALKIVKSRMPAKMEQKFQTELQIHSKMRHKNIVEFFRAFSFNSCTYLALEICPNASLMEMVKRRKGLTEPEVRFYSVQIAGAIKYMHAKGVIHRDLKMGNIFLDSKMNAKIGDFGLAALVVTGRDMQTIRRTTLCGTPNYIAPEILEKGKKGHDHMVDIWSLGIIMFAMLTSKPPFQSSTTDEIYRKARERDYEWPTVEMSQKYISVEAKEIVATMLEDALDRPDPDLIVQHRFFTSGYMPSEAEMVTRLRELPPDREDFYRSPMGATQRNQAYKNLKDMCRECCVGRWNQVQVTHSQIWKEMAAEEKAGLTPMIPLADSLVYRPYDETVRDHQQKLAASIPLPTGSSTDERGGSTLPMSPVGLLRQPPQSFAAQQRAQGRPTMISNPVQPKRALDAPPLLSQSTRARPRRELPSAAPTVVMVEDIAASKDAPSVPRTTARPIKRATSVRVNEKTVPVIKATTMVAQRPTSESIRSTTLFNPAEQAVTISGTSPESILDRLRALQTELERALNSRSMAIVSAKMTTPPHPHVVVKWVDYTNKFGLGYILNDGSVGCVLRDIPTTEGSKTAMLPPAGVFVRNAERHIMRRDDVSYADRNQPVPMTEPIKFFENNGEGGLTELVVPSENFRVAINEDGSAGKMTPGRDIHQHRKRERVILWKKFANYMMAYGRDDALPIEENDVASPGVDNPLAELVTFYQRFGDVGCWVFCDGHLQFNFPDHTKIVLDAAGTWCHFWHLPLDAAERLSKTGTIGATALDDRAMLSYPLQTLLNFQSKPARTTSTRRRPEIAPELQGLPAANDFRRKIEFIKSVVKEWVTNGGMGNSVMQRESRLRWTGYREVVTTTEPQKHVWVTIGARWGDQRLSTYVDPRRPSELGEEIESARK